MLNEKKCVKNNYLTNTIAMHAFCSIYRNQLHNYSGEITSHVSDDTYFINSVSCYSHQHQEDENYDDTRTHFLYKASLKEKTIWNYCERCNCYSTMLINICTNLLPETKHVKRAIMSPLPTARHQRSNLN